jgi:transcriptional regulator with XRE-family HTH domain
MKRFDTTSDVGLRETLDARVRRLRENLGLSVEGLAELAGVTVEDVREFESGAVTAEEVQAAVRLVRDLGIALGVSYEYLVLGTGPR